MMDHQIAGETNKNHEENGVGMCLMGRWRDNKLTTGNQPGNKCPEVNEEKREHPEEDMLGYQLQVATDG